MSAEVKFSLKEGHVLDGRYVIKRCLGAGGFGITYLAENLNIGIQYAIKELFPRFIVCRGEDGASVQLLYEGQEVWEKQMQDFLREARILGEYAGEEAVVRVHDYFKANGTAYMVMEYLDGRTLLEKYKDQKAERAEDIFRKMIPVARSLSRLHASSLIHRDISPENLMETGDGSVKLMDFGSATDWADTRERELLLKEGYAPPEQYTKEGALGPWTDLYALCASIYFCITGITPVSSISRVFVDDLKKPSALGIEIDPRLEEILMKGLDPDKSDRYQNMDSFLEAAGRVLPDPDTAAKKGNSRKLTFFPGLLVILLCAVLLTAGFVFYRNKARILLSRIPVTAVRISPADDAGAVDFARAADLIHKRLDYFAGKDHYLWEEDHGSINVTLARDTLNEKGAAYAFQSYLCAPMHLSLVALQINAEKLNEAAGSLYSPDFLSGREIPVENEWIREAVRLKTDSDPGTDKTENPRLQIFLTEEGEEALKEYTRTNIQCPMTLTVDPFFCVDARMTGDQNSFILEIPDPEENYIETLRYALSAGGFEKSARVRCEFQTDWEKAGTENSGEYQCEAESFEGDTVTLEYRAEDFGVFTDALYDTSLKENDRPGKTMSLLVLKLRLDSLEIPYAVGFSQSDSEVIHLRFPAGSITRLESDLLFVKNELKLQSPWRYIDQTIYNTDALRFRSEEGYLIMEGGSDLKDLSAGSFNTASRKGDTPVNIFLGGRRIGSFLPEEAGSGSVSEIAFSAPLYKGAGGEDEKRESLARLMTAVLRKGFDKEQDLSYYRLCNVEYRSQDGEIDWARSLPEGLPDLNVSADAGWKNNLQNAVAEKGGDLQILHEDTDYVQAYIRLSNLDREDLASAGNDLLRKVWTDPGSGVSSGELSRLEIACTENTGGRHSEGNYTVKLNLQKVAEDHMMKLEKPEVYMDTSDWTYDYVMVNDEADPVRSQVTDLLETDDFLKEIPKEYD